MRSETSDVPAEAVVDPAAVVVLPGDSWTVIAGREGVDVAALVDANGGQAARPLIVGEVLARP